MEGVIANEEKQSEAILPKSSGYKPKVCFNPHAFPLIKQIRVFAAKIQGS
jgi:hypothetical protein